MEKIVAPWRGSKTELIRGVGYLFLMVMLLRPRKLMQGQRVLSVLETKKKTVQRVEEEEQIMPAASLSGLDLRYMKGRMDMKGSREFQSDCRRVDNFIYDKRSNKMRGKLPGLHL